MWAQFKSLAYYAVIDFHAFFRFKFCFTSFLLLVIRLISFCLRFSHLFFTFSGQYLVAHYTYDHTHRVYVYGYMVMSARILYTHDLFVSSLILRSHCSLLSFTSSYNTMLLLQMLQLLSCFMHFNVVLFSSLNSIRCVRAVSSHLCSYFFLMFHSF